MRRIAAALALTLVLAGTALAQEKEERQGDTITFELKSNVVFVRGTINGQGPFTFIFDTGASVTVIRPQTAEKLGLVKKKAEDPEKPKRKSGGGLGALFGAGMNMLKLESISLGKAVLKDFPCVSMGVPQADLPLTMQGISYDGIIGYNYISQFVTTIDYKNKTIKLVPTDYEPGDLLGGSAFGGRPRAAEKDGKAHLGFTYSTIGDDYANEIGVEGGVVVKFVEEESPAAKGGLQKGDVIQQVDGKRVDTADDYRKLLRSFKPGQKVKFSVVREKKDAEATVEVGSRE